jgi:hypothetical protein
VAHTTNTCSIMGDSQGGSILAPVLIGSGAGGLAGGYAGTGCGW